MFNKAKLAFIAAIESFSKTPSGSVDEWAFAEQMLRIIEQEIINLTPHPQ